MHHLLSIDASPSQLSKLRRGHAVRIRKGTGFNIIVHPETYKLASRAFKKDKGYQVQLSPEEIEMNRSLTPELHQEAKEATEKAELFNELPFAGQGIFGPKFDRMLKKAGVKKIAYKIGDQLKPHVKNAITAGLTAGSTALSAMQPELAPFIAPAAMSLNTVAHDYIDSPDKYHRGIAKLRGHGIGGQIKSGIKGMPVRDLAEQDIKSKMADKLNKHLGTNYDYMGRAGIENALASEMQARLSRQSTGARFSQPPADYDTMHGRGIYHRRMIEGGTIGNHGGFVHYHSPALESQPLSANFHMQFWLPPSYQEHFKTGHGLYSGKGLYSGGGLY